MSAHELLVTICHIEGIGDPFVCHANGKFTVNDLLMIEADLRENWVNDLVHGDGEYLFTASWFSGQFGEYGRCEFAPGWELSLLSFNAMPIVG